MWGILAVDHGFELLCAGSPVGRCRHLNDTAVFDLKGFSDRYRSLLGSSQPAAGLLALGRDLYGWLNSDDAQLTRLLQQADRPLRFEVCTADRYPSEAEWALLRAPWELLAGGKDFLAGDVGLGFSPVRRVGRRTDAPPLDRHRLGLVFMAASPQGAQELDYEREETAIMEAAGSTKLDLLVEESGNPGELGKRLNEYTAMQVLHLSCHGHNAWPGKPSDKPRPVLLMETPEGGELPTDADQLIQALRAHQLRLVFLSACLTAAAGGEKRNGLPPGPGDKDSTASARGAAYSLAEALVNAGLPAVLGWDGSVADTAATAFAATLYGALEGRHDLADAVAAARRDLLNAPEEHKRRDWHLARLWLGPKGGGPVAGGSVLRGMMPATHGHKQFLVKERQQVPVASHEMFVGRRRELQKALRALRDGAYAGVLVHGMGRLGKSSLAARIANRRRDLRLAVVFEHYGTLDVLAALAEALKDSPKARDMLRIGTDLVRQQPDRLADVLTDLLCGPCGQMEADGTPVLLVIDDLERILEADPRGGRHRFKQDAPVLAAALRAFDAAVHAGLSRLVITSRYPFTLDGLEQCLFELPLPPLSDTAQRKLELRQKEAAADAGLAGTAFDERKAMLTRVPGIARGNPGLQDLIGRKMILSTTVPVERVRQTLTEMEAWLRQGGLPSDAEVREFLENLAVDALLDLAGRAGQAALRKLTLFDLPVPQRVADKLASADNASLSHLRDLGLIDMLVDMADHRQPAFAVNALAAGRLAQLTDSERDQLASAVTHDLFVAWGGAEGANKRPSVCALQLTRLGLLAADGEVVESCATDAVIALRQGPAASGAALGRATIDLLDSQRRTPPWPLLSETAAAVATGGDGVTADMLLERGVSALEEQRRSGATVDPVAAGFLVYEQAQRLMIRGELDQAQWLFMEAIRFAEAAGNEISATVAHGAIADILASRGDLDATLRILREELLPVYERLGDVRERALTVGKIADILARRGDLDAALRILREELLPVYERLGDMRSRALTMGKIAQILLQKGDAAAARVLQEERLEINRRLADADGIGTALWDLAQLDFAEEKFDAGVPRIIEAYEIMFKFGRADGIAVIGRMLGQILAAGENPAGALTILQRSAEMFLKLGREDEAKEAQDLIRQLSLER
jgi:tetratricopeptide (TPR) repeat protein